ncbi:MAG: class I SAM-dependent methyltransferase [Cytophagales bacterium]|nr:class I SAM-dependent methyltransferase [Armatimonadota bacterium]
MTTPDSSPPVFNFDRVAAEYESTRYLPPVVAERLAQQVTRRLVPEDWFLDAGIGTGRVGRALLRQHPRTVGIDISEAMLRQLRTSYGGGAASLPLALADLRALPFADGQFRAALTVHVLHLIPFWEQALGELWRVIRPGGLFILGVEDRTASVVRDYFFARASERKALPRNRSGAHSAEVIRSLRERGVSVEEHRPLALQWTQSIRADETLDLLRRRTYSILWEMPEAVLLPLVEETRSWTIQRFGNPDLAQVTETIDFQMVLFVASKPLGDR